MLRALSLASYSVATSGSLLCRRRGVNLPPFAVSSSASSSFSLESFACHLREILFGLRQDPLNLLSSEPAAGSTKFRVRIIESATYRVANQERVGNRACLRLRLFLLVNRPYVLYPRILFLSLSLLFVCEFLLLVHLCEQPVARRL